MITRFRILSLSCLLLAALALPENSHAEKTLYEEGGTTIKGSFEAGASALRTRNPNFGNGYRGKTNYGWFEGYLKPGITARHTLDNSSAVYAGYSAVAVMTRGDGDPSNFSPSQPSDVETEDAYVGWNTGALKSSALGEYSLDLSAGRQKFVIGDGFLINDGHFDQAEDGAFWLAPRRAYDMTTLLKIDTRPVRGDLFYLQGGKDFGNAGLVGANVEYVAPENRGTLGLYGFQVFHADPAFNVGTPDSRDKLNTISMRGAGNPFASLPGLFLSAELAQQWNEDSVRPVRAWAGYGEVGYRLAAQPWQPMLSYRYATFSGDDPESSDDEAFDALFYGSSSRGWGTWFMGEITGSYLVPNTNANIHMLHLNVLPSASTAGGVAYYHYRRDEPVAGANSAAFSDEINLYGEWQALSFLRLFAVASAAAPRDAAIAEFGNNRTYHLLNLFAIVSF
jgi:Alginate export